MSSVFGRRRPESASDVAEDRERARHRDRRGVGSVFFSQPAIQSNTILLIVVVWQTTMNTAVPCVPAASRREALLVVAVQTPQRAFELCGQCSARGGGRPPCDPSVTALADAQHSRMLTHSRGSR